MLASAFVKDDIRLSQSHARSTLERLQLMKGQDHPNEAIYFAVLNAKRRLPDKMKGLLVVEELKECNPMSEDEFRAPSRLEVLLTTLGKKDRWYSRQRWTV